MERQQLEHMRIYRKRGSVVLWAMPNGYFPTGQLAAMWEEGKESEAHVWDRRDALALRRRVVLAKKERLVFVPVEPDPPNILAMTSDLGLRVVSYQSKTDESGKYWLPRDVVGQDGKTLIVYREADREYSIAGWCPWHDGMFGGRKSSYLNALAWVQRAMDVRSGKAKDFLGA